MWLSDRHPYFLFSTYYDCKNRIRPPSDVDSNWLYRHDTLLVHTALLLVSKVESVQSKLYWYSGIHLYSSSVDLYIRISKFSFKSDLYV